MDQTERTARAKLGAHTSWANTPDPTARTEAARRAADDRFEKQVDPEGVLPADERARRAAHARKAFYAAIQLKSATARRKRANKKAAATKTNAA